MTPRGECWVARNSTPVLDATGNRQKIHSTIWDITKQKQLELRLQASQHIDLMTGLANREACLEHIRTLLSVAKKQNDSLFSIVYIDIDRSKLSTTPWAPAMATNSSSRSPAGCSKLLTPPTTFSPARAVTNSSPCCI